MTRSTAPKPPVIVVDDVRMKFGDFEVLRGVSFEVRRGETLCVLGGSGGGKSTLLKIMIGALRPTGGSVVFEGEDITKLSEREMDTVRRKFGVMFQGGALLNSLTLAENVALPMEYHGRLDAEDVKTLVVMKLQQVGLLHAADRLPTELSGGMQKRAAVARALALDPRVIFYDEPSAGLDPVTTTRIDQLINQLKITMGMTNVVVTHVMESVQRIADRILMLDKGEVVLDGSLEDLLASDDPRIVQFRTGDLGNDLQDQVGRQEYYRDLLA